MRVPSVCLQVLFIAFVVHINVNASENSKLIALGLYVFKGHFSGLNFGDLVT